MRIYLSILLMTILFSCQKKDKINSIPTSSNNDPWLVPISEIIHMDAERDKIKSIDSAIFTTAEFTHLNDDEMVVAYHFNGETRVFPVSALGSHEIVNDQIGDHYYSITYCPLTESAIAWDRNIGGSLTSFGVSGKLFNNNLIPYDRSSGSHWSQMKSLCVNGDLIGFIPQHLQLIRTRYSTIKRALPDALFLLHDSCDSGICELKQGAEAGDPSNDNSGLLEPDARYFGVTDRGSLLLFNYTFFGYSPHLLQTHFNSISLVVIGDVEQNIFAAFKYLKQGNDHLFSPLYNQLPAIMKDNSGNVYDLFGNIIEGPDTGTRLQAANAYTALTYSWEGLFSDIRLYKND